MNRHRVFAALRLSLSVVVLMGTLSPAAVSACACGCGVFEVGTSSMFPNKPGGAVSLEYDFLNQNQNWSGTSKAPADDNDDKHLRSNFFTAGILYMFDRSWGVMAEFPYTSRYFKTTGDDGTIGSFTHSAVGDIRVGGVYSGFSPDMSSGLTFGVKLPTGDFSDPDFDRDTSIGTGSTNILLGAYHMGRVAGAGAWAWFTNAQLDQPALIAGGYRPGGEVDGALGVYYDGWRLGGVKIAPLAQAVGSWRGRDSGVLADSPDSGYSRVILAPGVEFDADGVRVYGDVGFPVYQNVNGNQLAAAQLYKLNISYDF